MEKVRLQKFMADAGIMSRRAAEQEIANGNVSVNGHVASLGTKIDPSTDIVIWKGKPVQPTATKHHYIALNKPRGYISSVSDPEGRKCVTDLLSDVPVRVYPVGRLDRVSEGLLLLTDDGALTNRLTHPSHSIGKVYRVKVDGHVTDAQIAILSAPVDIDGYTTKPAEVRANLLEDEDATVLHITLHEGRNRQIRHLCDAAGLTVRRLIRVSIGNLKLGGLGSGKWRYLEQEEVEYLYRATKG